MIGKKSIMSWNVPAVVNGDPVLFADLLVNLNFEAVCLKVADGPYPHKFYSWSPWPTWGENVRPELINALKDRKILIYFWHYVYGYNIAGELYIARTQCDRFEPDGYIWNAESAFDRKANAEYNARFLSNGLASSHNWIDQGLCWWALPESPLSGAEWHPKRVALAFLETVEVGMPMMYWQGQGATAALDYLEKSLRIWRGMTDRPICPIGRAYNGDGGYADASGITAFANAVYELAPTKNLVGNSWYSLDKVANYPSWGFALSETPKFGEKHFLTPEEKLERLVNAHPDLFPEYQ